MLQAYLCTAPHVQFSHESKNLSTSSAQQVRSKYAASTQQVRSRFLHSDRCGRYPAEGQASNAISGRKRRWPPIKPRLQHGCDSPLGDVGTGYGFRPATASEIGPITPIGPWLLLNVGMRFAPPLSACSQPLLNAPLRPGCCRGDYRFELEGLKQRLQHALVRIRRARFGTAVSCPLASNAHLAYDSSTSCP